MENQTIHEYPETNQNDEGIASPQNQMNDQQLSQQAYLQKQQNDNSFTFNNPWGSSQSLCSIAADQYSQQTMNNTSQSHMSGDDYSKRRKSSIIIPPSRGSGIVDPFLRNHAENQEISPQDIDAYQKQKQIFSNESEAYKQSLLDPSSILYDSDVFYRRRSLANTSLNNSGNGPHNNIFQLSDQLSPNSSHASMVQQRGIPNRSGSYRRLSAYNSNLHSPFKNNFRDDLSGLQQTTIVPQMIPCNNRAELHPCVNKLPKYRRASLNSTFISPLVGLTRGLITTYSLCSSDFQYKTSKNPRRVLTKPNEGVANNGYDNLNSDYILYVNDVLGTEQNRKYLVLDILGQGTFGQVVKCQNILTKEIVAVKVVKSRMEYLNQSVSEAKILEILNQQIDPYNKHHFLRLHDTFVHKNHLCLAFELLSSNLYEILKQNRFHGLNLSIIKTFSRQLLDSLSVLKCAKIVHCDLKPENILLAKPDKPEIKVIDFGSSCEERKTLYTYIQSRFYRSPEVILGIPYSTSIDMWSFGCIVAELFLGIPVFPGASEFNQITRIIDSLGYPPSWMIDRGKNSGKYFKFNENSETSNEQKYRLKQVDEYNQEYGTAEKPSKQYFKWKTLEDVIKNYRIPKHIQNNEALIEKEMQERMCLTHFLKGALNLNPLERWTPQQALMHPFITGQPFSTDWYPLGSLPTLGNLKDIPQDSNYILKSVGNEGTAASIQNEIEMDVIENNDSRLNSQSNTEQLQHV